MTGTQEALSSALQRLDQLADSTSLLTDMLVIWGWMSFFLFLLGCLKRSLATGQITRFQITESTPKPGGTAS